MAAPDTKRPRSDPRLSQPFRFWWFAISVSDIQTAMPSPKTLRKQTLNANMQNTVTHPNARPDANQDHPHSGWFALRV